MLSPLFYLSLKQVSCQAAWIGQTAGRLRFGAQQVVRGPEANEHTLLKISGFGSKPEPEWS
jgi:hypothetical protein